MSVSLLRRVWVVLAVWSLSLTSTPAAPPSAGEEFFEKEVRPLLVERCQQCHAGSEPKGGLKLTLPDQPPQRRRYRLSRRSGKAGPELARPRHPLHRRAENAPQAEIDRARKQDPDALGDAGGALAGSCQRADHDQSRERLSDQPRSTRRFWSFQPVKPATPPEVEDGTWVQNPLDRFILRRLEVSGLKPAPPADKRTLDPAGRPSTLTGLPPTPEEVEGLCQGRLAPGFCHRHRAPAGLSPLTGSAWGRHLARPWSAMPTSFDARGLGGETDIADAWRYRDWVVDAFNRDLPYDQFVTQQLAGDLLTGDQKASTARAPSPRACWPSANWGGGDADKEKLPHRQSWTIRST